MCGRAYETYTDEELELRYFNEKRKRNPLGSLKPNFNLAPTQLSPVVLFRDGELQLDLFRWGLVPFWAKDIKSAENYSLINAKSEEIAEKRSYKAAFEKRRCIVPLSGFFEWKKSEAGSKHPYAIRLKSESIMSVAGIWEHWESKETKVEVNSFSIITCSANSFMESIHNRMPVILAKEDEKVWLDPENHDLDALKNFLKPCPSEWLAGYEVSKLVNSPKNNTTEVLNPISNLNPSSRQT
jgi:putative SOS response-associated peptidase YedK